MKSLLVVPALVLCAPVTDLGAQTQRAPVLPHRSSGRPEASSKPIFDAVSNVYEVGGGAVVVYDIKARTTTRLNARLDSAAEFIPADGRGSTPGALLRWRGDSLLYVDPGSFTMQVIGQDGTNGRTIATPPFGTACLVGSAGGLPGGTAEGHIVCRLPPRSHPGTPRQGSAPVPVLEGVAPPVIEDSAAVVRYDPSTRRTDTLAFVRAAAIRISEPILGAGCTWWLAPIINPMPIADDWALAPNGELLIVRSANYRIDRVDRTGRVVQYAPIPYGSRRLEDDEKSRFIDSTRIALRRLRGDSAAADSQAGRCDPERAGRIATVPAASTADLTTYATSRRGPPLLLVQPQELPDYVPAFEPGWTRVDLAGNLWVRVMGAVDGGPVYDVLSSEGQRIDRIVLPRGRVLVGFGDNSAMYTAATEDGRVKVERTRIVPRRR